MLLCIHVPPASASERDVHYMAVFVLGRLSGVKHDDALLIARASQSMDENAETSPLPDSFKTKAPPWFVRTKRWHSLAPETVLIRTLGAQRQAERRAAAYVQNRLIQLYRRARQEPDARQAKIYFGQYLHALADSVAHKGFYSLVGHGLKGHTPDVPLAQNRKKIQQILVLVSGAYTRFQRDRLGGTPTKVAAAQRAVVARALSYAAPTEQVPLHMREQIVHQRLQRQFANIKIPTWAQAGALVFNGAGRERKGAINRPRDINKYLSYFFRSLSVIRGLAEIVDGHEAALKRAANLKAQIAAMQGQVTAYGAEERRFRNYCRGTYSAEEVRRRRVTCLRWERRLNVRRARLVRRLQFLDRARKNALAHARNLLHRLRPLLRRARTVAGLSIGASLCGGKRGNLATARCYVRYYRGTN